jgi:hypothetical protein
MFFGKFIVGRRHPRQMSTLITRKLAASVANFTSRDELASPADTGNPTSLRMRSPISLM